MVFWWKMWLPFALSCLKSLSEANVKRFMLIALIKEVSKKPSRDFLLWLGLKKRILNKCCKLRKEIYKRYGSGMKGAPGSEMELNPLD